MLLFPNANSLYTLHVGDQDANGTSGIKARSLSPRLWSRISNVAVAPDGNGGCTWFGDDFTGFTGLSAENAGALTYPEEPP